MQKYNCPSCGAEITFQSSISVSCVCPYCRSLVVRHDANVEAIGKMAELPQDISPFQLGTAGVYKNVHFTLIGRLKIGWEDGAWNEWFMLTDDGKKGWLAEAQGFLAVSFEQEIAEGQPVATDTKGKDITTPDTMPGLGFHIIIQKKWYEIEDIKESSCIGSEGELPFPAPQGRKTMSVDMLAKDGGFACIEYGDGKPPRLFIGEYVEFDDLKFTNLRELPGWANKPPATPAPKTKKAADGQW